MENQHRKIKSYRELSQGEIDLMNSFKEKEAELLELMKQVEYTDSSELSREQRAEQLRCLVIAKETLQTGFMWSVRSIALPNT